MDDSPGIGAPAGIGCRAGLGAALGAVEVTAQQWHQLGRPARHRLGLTAHTDGTHAYWLDHPDQELRVPAGKGSGAARR